VRGSPGHNALAAAAYSPPTARPIMALAGLAIGPAAGVSMAATHSAATPGITVNPPAPSAPQPNPWDD